MTTATARRIAVIATGGTIAGATTANGYRAAVLPIAQLLAAAGGLPGIAVQAEQLFQLDSKDVDGAHWARLVGRLRALQQEPGVDGIVVTHGTDTLEETAWLLALTVACRLPVVLTAAMRPADAPDADGPQNLRDAITVAADRRWTTASAQVVAVVQRQLFAADALVKVHSQAVDAFGSRMRPVLPLGGIPPAQPRSAPLADLALPEGGWPDVPLLTSHGDSRGSLVAAATAAGVAGLAVAATGAGTLGQPLQQALENAAANGLPVVCASRCAAGGVGSASAHGLVRAGQLTAVQARLALQLALIAGIGSGAALQRWFDILQPSQ